ncbi:site-2 protease family protein [Planctomicrobium sp. SH661]|uniref:site-2 protease family protein n=1 Tax=Planctomicrobium sp. SH661 TaxID=3448124 RepID=UPI003F5C5144
MDIRQNPLWLSIPSGQLFHTEIRVSVWYFLFGLGFCLTLGWQVGLAVTVLLFLSLLVHELAHILAARKTGGSGHEILIWPLGGLAFASPAPTFYSEFWTIIAGPISNGILCLCCLPVAMSSDSVRECLSLLTIPRVDLTADLANGLCLLLLSINFKLLVLNLLLPIFPLDCGQLIYSAAKIYWDRQTAKIGSLWVGMVCCLLLLFVAWRWESINLIVMGFVLMMICQYEFIAAQISRSFDDSFMGYDFSQGYTSLEGGDDREARRPGILERWRRERAEKKREQEQLQKLETERRLDELLEKIHQHGKASLTADEHRFLQRASSRYRSPGKE